MASFFEDILKFCGHVSHEVLAAQGIEFGFPLALLRPLLAMYSGHRVVIVGKACSEAILAYGTILPGCGIAATAASSVSDLSR